MAKISSKASLCAVACLTALLMGCTVHKGADGKTALWSVVAKPKARAKDLKDPAALNLAYARWQEQLGQINDARQAYEFVLTDDPKSTDAILGLARLDQLAGRAQQAEAGVEKALKLKPEDPHVLHSAGQFYAAKNDWSKATDLLTKAMTADPKNDTYRYSFAVALARSGRIDESMPHFVATVGAAEAEYNIGYILYQQGHLADAENHLEEAIEKRPELKQAKQVLAQVRTARKDAKMLAATPARRAAKGNVEQATVQDGDFEARQPVQQTSGTQHSRQRLRPRQPVKFTEMDEDREPMMPGASFPQVDDHASGREWFEQQ